MDFNPLLFAAALIIFSALNFPIAFASCGQVSVSNDKIAVGSQIIINVIDAEPSAELVINSPSNSYRLLGEAFSQVPFVPKEAGSYSVELWNSGTLCDSRNFTAEEENLKEPEKTFKPLILWTDKREYILGESVLIHLNPSDYGYSPQNLILKIDSGAESYTFLDSLNSTIAYYPPHTGNYTLVLLDTSTSLIWNSSFSVVLPEVYIPQASSSQVRIDLSGVENPERISNVRFIIRRKNGKEWNYSLKLSEENQQGIPAEPDYNATIEISGSFIKKIELKKLKIRDDFELPLNELSVESIKNIKTQAISGNITNAFSINPAMLNFSEGYITLNASGNELWKCADWDYDAQSCIGDWKKQQDIVPGQEYTFYFNSTDPGYAEFSTANITSIAVTPLGEDNFAVAYCDDTNDRIAFKVYRTNGTLITSETVVDSTAGACDYNSVSVSTFDPNRFVIGWYDSGSSYASFAVYNKNGTVYTSRIDVDTTAGTSMSVSVSAFNSTAFVFGWYDQPDLDASFQTYSILGSAISSVVDVDTRAGTCNAVSVSAFNSTAFVFGYYDQASSDMTFRTYTSSGTAISAITDVDTGAGANSRSISVSAINTSAFAILWYDQNSGYIRFRRYTVGGTLIGSEATPDTAVGTGADAVMVSTAAINKSEFAISWYDSTTDTGIFARTYDASAAAISGEVSVQPASLRYNAVAGYSAATDIGFCSGNFIVAFANTTSQAVFKAYLRNGSDWSGVCPDIAPPVVNLSAPENSGIVESSSVSFNFTATDNRDTILPNCSLWANFSGTFSLNKTIYNVPTGNTTNITVSGLADKNYIWNIQCYDNSNNSAFAEENFSFYLNHYAPLISSPALNESVVNQSRKVKFNASITDSYGISYAYITVLYPNGSSYNHSLNISGSDKYYVINETVQNGTYEITYIWANDSLGQVSYNDNPGLSFIVTLSPPGNFDLLSPANLAESRNLIPNLFWQQSSDADFLNYTIIIDLSPDFSSPDYTYYNPGISNTSRVVDYALDANKKYYWMVIANDMFGSSTNSTSSFAYITDTLAPSISLDYPENNTFSATNLSLFNFTPAEANTIGSCVLYGNFTGSFLPNESLASPSNGQTNSISSSLPEGVYLWNVRCNDSAGNFGFAQQNNTVIVDLNGPSTELLSPPNMSVYSTSNNVIFTINATDAMSGISSCSLIVNEQVEQTKTNVQNGIPYNFTNFLMNGNYTWGANCTDLNGHLSVSPRYNLSVLVIDTNPPLVTLNYPPSSSYISNSSISFNYTAEDATGIENCSLFIDGIKNSTDTDVENLDFNYFNVSEISEWHHNWSVQCFDNSTEHNSYAAAAKNFTVDLTNPEVSLESPADASFYISSTVELNYTPSDSNLKNCSLYGNFSGIWELQSTEYSPANGSINSFSIVLSDGTYVWNVLCYDLSGRSSYAPANYTVSVDMTAPSYSGLSSYPVSPVNYSSITYYFNITWADNFEVASVYFESNFSGSPFNESVSSLGQLYSVNKSGLNASYYSYRWYAYDAAGNLNYTDMIYYQVDKAPSNVSLLLNGTDDNLTINEDSSINITAALITPDSGYIEIYINGNLAANGSSPQQIEYNFGEPGVYNITAIYNETANYLSGGNIHFLFVSDITPPVINLIYPGNNSKIGTNDINFQYNVSDSSEIANCSLFINGTLNQTNSSVLRDTVQTFFLTVEDGDYSWRIDCYDNASNFRQGDTYYFTSLNSEKIIAQAYPKKPSYEKGDTASLIANTSDVFGSPLSTSIYANVIKGNTSLEWWNISFKYRRPIFSTNNLNTSFYKTVDLNISGLDSSISNCSEIRIVQNSLFNHTRVPSTVIAEDSNNSCVVQFNINASALISNQNNYYAYYGNSSVSATGDSVPLYGIRVQRGSVAGTATSLSDSMNAVNTSQAFVLFGVNVASSVPARWEITARIASSTQVVFDRYVKTTSANVSWQVINGSDIYVQRDTSSFAATDTNTTVNIENVNLNETFIIISGRTSSTTAANSNMGFLTARFLNSSAIYIERGTNGSTATAEWQVVSWKGARVQSGNLSFTTTSANADINSINTSRSFLIFSRAISGSTYIGTNIILGNFTNSTQIYFERKTAGGTASVAWFAVELPPDFEVQRGTISLTADTNVGISRVVPEKTFNLHSSSSVGATSTTYANAQIRSILTNETNLWLDRTSGTNSNTIGWFTIEEKYLNVSSGMEQQLMTSDSGSSGIDGIYNLDWNSDNNPVGNYSFVYVASKENFTSARAQATFQLVPDITPPNVTLFLPTHLYKQGVGFINFTYLPYDLNLANCTLYFGTGGSFAPNATNSSPINNGTNSFSDIYLGVGLYSWNVKCEDTEGNSGFALSNFTLNITGSDLFPSAIWFSNTERIEGVNTTVYANISNMGLSPCNQSFIVQFFRGNPSLGGQQIEGNKTIQNLSIDETKSVSASFPLSAGPNDIYVLVDPNNIVNESDESNNNASSSISVELYQYYYGNITSTEVLSTSENKSIFNWTNTNSVSGLIFVADIDSNFQFSNLQALTRNINGQLVSNDFSDLDTVLNTTSFSDSVKNVWGSGTETPIAVASFNISGKIIDNVPIVNSTNSSDFITGMLWDIADDSSFNFQYDSSDKEDIVFVTKVHQFGTGRFGSNDYEIRVPSYLKTYKPNINLVVFYTQLN